MSTKIQFKNLDFGTLRDTVEKTIVESVNGLLEGTTEDIKSFAADISRDLILAAAANRPDLIEIMQDQLGLLAEINRLRVAAQAQATLIRVISTVATFALNLVIQAAVAA